MHLDILFVFLLKFSAPQLRERRSNEPQEGYILWGKAFTIFTIEMTMQTETIAILLPVAQVCDFSRVLCNTDVTLYICGSRVE